MKKILLAAGICLSISFAFLSFNEKKETKLTLSLQERLGYPKDAKLLIIHADDIGVSHSENAASMEALQRGTVNSGSIMVPCPWFLEIADFAKKNPQMDLGIHLTFNSEWKHYRWSPVLHENVSSLMDSMGYFYKDYDGILNKAKITEIENEMRAQIKKAIAAGVDVTHLDSHMGALFITPELISTYIKMGKEFKIPVLLDTAFLRRFNNVDIRSLINDDDVVVNQTYIAEPANYKEGLPVYYERTLRNLQAGVNVILLHAALDEAEMQAVTIDHPDWGATWRQEDFNFFTSDHCRKILKEEKIILVSWREIRDKIVRAGIKN